MKPRKFLDLKVYENKRNKQRVVILPKRGVPVKKPNKVRVEKWWK